MYGNFQHNCICFMELELHLNFPATFWLQPGFGVFQSGRQHRDWYIFGLKVMRTWSCYCKEILLCPEYCTATCFLEEILSLNHNGKHMDPNHPQYHLLEITGHTVREKQHCSNLKRGSQRHCVASKDNRRKDWQRGAGRVPSSEQGAAFFRSLNFLISSFF